MRYRGDSFVSSATANDVPVAATALRLGFAVLVGGRDEQHFRRVPNLTVRTVPA